MSTPEEAEGPSGRPETVDPMIRAHILSLCSALGGSSTAEGEGYTLGDDALACLKDLKRWLKLYDEKMNRFDVARCMSEANLVKGDLLEILASWGDDETEDRSKLRLALACVELLVPLTWPFEKYNDQMTVNHHRHIPVLRFAQASYKKAILQHPSRKILASVVRVALPSMAILASERTERDEGIIKLVLFFFRNLAMIEHPMPTETDTGEEISRSSTILALESQNVLHLLLAMSSEMGSEFNTQDVVVMEVIYHLVKSVDIERLFMGDQEESQRLAKDLTTLLRMEDDMKRSGAKSASTRHNRFGTTVWMEREDGRRSFVSGQGALLGKATGLQKMDSSKKWKKPTGSDPKGISRKTDYDMTLTLEPAAKSNLRIFVQSFLDAAFNPLFMHVRRAIDRDAQRLLDTNQRQYFYLIAWFLKAERVRRKAIAASKGPAAEEVAESFGLVASVLNQESLITLNRRMVDWFEMKQWVELQSVMRCFTQILLTVQDMAISPLDGDQEIADNIQNRLFYEESTLDLVAQILRSYTKQPFGWLDDCTEMVHVHLKMLERFSKQHEHMFVRSRIRRKQKRKETGMDEEPGSGEEDLAELSKNTMKERAFDYSRFETKFLTQNCTNTFLAFLGHYKELNYSQMKRAITFFHRIFVKRGEEVLLFRLDIVELFHRIMQDPDGLPASHPARKEMDQFVKHFLKKLFKKLEATPELYVELLFTKVNSTMHYLQHGYDKEAKVSKPREAVELQIRPGMEYKDRLGVSAGALLDEDKGGAVEWLKSVLSDAISERKAWEAEAAARDPESVPETVNPPFIWIKPDSDERKTAMVKDGKLRLLLTTLGFEKLAAVDTIEMRWIIPSPLTSGQLQESLDLLKHHTNSPPTYEDGMIAEDFISKKPKPRAKIFDSDDDGGDSDGDDDGDGDDMEMMFEPGGPTAMKPIGERKKLSKRLKTRDEPDDELVAERRLKRIQREKEKLAAIKSDKFVHDSDDESDPERDSAFFEKERRQRLEGPKSLQGGDAPQLDFMKYGFGQEDAPVNRKRKKEAGEKRGGRRKRRAIESDGAEDTTEDRDGDEEIETVVRNKSVDTESDSGLESGSGNGGLGVARNDEDGEDEDAVPLKPPTTRRRGPVILESDSE